MNIQENKISDSELEFTIDLERQDFEKDLQDAAKRISESIEIKGFRKGLAPYDIVCRSAGGEAKIYEEAIQKIVSNVLTSVIRERKFDIASNPEISIKKMVPGFGISFLAKICLAPIVEIGDISKIKLEKKQPKIEDKDVDEVINSLRQMRVKEASVSREARVGDKIVLDFEIKRDNVAIENGKAKDYHLVLGERRFIPGFEEQVVGQKQGDKKTFELKFPDQYHEKSLAGKPAQFFVSVKQIFERTLPEFNDDFAKNFGDYSSAEDLRTKIFENIKYEKTMEEKERFEMAVMGELVKLSSIGNIPQIMIKNEIENMIHELESDVSRQGANFEDYLKSINKTREDLSSEFSNKAQDRIKLMLIASKFGKSENIQAKDEDIDKEIEIHKKSYHSNPEAIARVNSAEYRNYLRSVMTSKAIFEKLAEKVLKS